MRKFVPGAELQLSLDNNVSTFKTSKFIVGPMQRVVLETKTYEHCLWNGALIHGMHFASRCFLSDTRKEAVQFGLMHNH